MESGSTSSVLVLAWRGRSRWDGLGELPPHRSRAIVGGQLTLILAAAIITGLLSCDSAHTISLSWDPSTSVVAGYNVYRCSQSGGPYTKLNPHPVTATTYTDRTVQSGQTYFYVVKAVNLENLESAPSEELSAAIPGNALLRSSGVVRKSASKKLQRGYSDAR